MIVTRRRLVATAASAALLRAPKGLPGAADLLRGPVSTKEIANDPLRPQFHLLPARNWMNDPNGPIYWKGNYHMFFQYNPNAAVWGDMHWAHTISTDMIRWKHMPVALAPTPDGDDQDGCFTGSAVDDRGIATIVYTAVKSVPADQATVRDGTHNFRETQCLATSTDSDLRTWKKGPKPIVLPPKEPGITGFRDPCLWRAENNWFMGIGSGIKGEGGRVLLYRSRNLRDWEYLHPLASGKRNDKQTNDAVDAGEMWECPDFFVLGKKHVLLYSTERKVYWESGELDSKELIFHREKRGLLDYGAFYAPKSQLDAKGRRILWGWITETRPEAEFKAAAWAGCMSLPRILTLAEDGTLRMAVISDMAKLREQEMSVPAEKTGVEDRLKTLGGIELRTAAAEIELRFRPRPIRLAISDGVQDIVRVVIDPTQSGSELQVGDRAVSVAFPHDAVCRLHIFLDGSVVECFLDGQLALTARTYRVPKANLHFQIPPEELPVVESLRVWPLRPISADRLTT